MAMSIQDVMTRNPVTLPMHATVTEAARVMREKAIGDVLVCRDDGTLCGVLTDRDVTVRMVAESLDPDQTEIGSICTGEPVTLARDSTIDDAISMMRKRAIRRIPVVEDGKPIGVVSLGDLAVERDRESALGQISAAPPNN
jgi:signal-transduction protein with cAMP-binding, CBS, and nucleotidyltransferase domain